MTHPNTQRYAKLLDTVTNLRSQLKYATRDNMTANKQTQTLARELDATLYAWLTRAEPLLHELDPEHYEATP